MKECYKKYRQRIVGKKREGQVHPFWPSRVATYCLRCGWKAWAVLETSSEGYFYKTECNMSCEQVKDQLIIVNPIKIKQNL